MTTTTTKVLEGGEQGFATTRLDALLGWARKYSLFNYPFVTACCGMEFMATAAAKYDIARFGAEFPRFSPRQADLLIVVGTITERQGPVLRRIYEQMCEPKWTVAFAQLGAADHVKGGAAAPKVLTYSDAITPVIHQGDICQNGTLCDLGVDNPVVPRKDR